MSMVNSSSSSSSGGQHHVFYTIRCLHISIKETGNNIHFSIHQHCHLDKLLLVGFQVMMLCFVMELTDGSLYVFGVLGEV